MMADENQAVINQLCDQVITASNIAESYRKIFKEMAVKHAEYRDLLFIQPSCILPSCQLKATMQALHVKEKESLEILQSLKGPPDAAQLDKLPVEDEHGIPHSLGPCKWVQSGNPGLKQGWRWVFIILEPRKIRGCVQVKDIWCHRKSTHLFTSPEKARKDAENQNKKRDMCDCMEVHIKTIFETPV